MDILGFVGFCLIILLGPGAFSQPSIARNFITQHILNKEIIGVFNNKCCELTTI